MSKKDTNKTGLSKTQLYLSSGVAVTIGMLAIKGACTCINLAVEALLGVPKW